MHRLAFILSTCALAGVGSCAPSRTAHDDGRAPSGESAAESPVAENPVTEGLRTDGRALVPEAMTPPVVVAPDVHAIPFVRTVRDVCAGNYAAAPQTVGALADAELVETSGLATSLVYPGVFYAHNDSGDGPRIFVVGPDGSALGRITLIGAPIVDAEDIATAPCPDREGACIWLADTGDNSRVRSDVSLYVLPEPSTDPRMGFVDVATSDFRRYRHTYAFGSVNVEGVTLSPDGRTIYLFEKTDADFARVFVLDRALLEDRIAVAKVLTTFKAPGVAFMRLGRAITAADLHPSGTRLLVRVYTGIFEYRFAPGQSIVDLDTIEPVLVALGPLDEPQGEAVTYDDTGRGVLSVSEDLEKSPGQPVHHVACEVAGDAP